MELLKQIGAVVPVTQHTYLIVFYFISASLIKIGMKSGVCGVSVLLICTVIGMGRCIFSLFHSFFMRGEILKYNRWCLTWLMNVEGYLVMIQLVTLKITFLENEISSAVNVEACHPLWGICSGLLFLSYVVKLDDKLCVHNFKPY